MAAALCLQPFSPGAAQTAALWAPTSRQKGEASADHSRAACGDSITRAFPAEAGLPGPEAAVTMSLGIMEEEDLAEYFRLQYGERLLQLLQ